MRGQRVQIHTQWTSSFRYQTPVATQSEGAKESCKRFFFSKIQLASVILLSHARNMSISCETQRNCFYPKILHQNRVPESELLHCLKRTSVPQNQGKCCRMTLSFTRNSPPHAKVKSGKERGGAGGLPTLCFFPRNLNVSFGNIWPLSKTNVLG